MSTTPSTEPGDFQAELYTTADGVHRVQITQLRGGGRYRDTFTAQAVVPWAQGSLILVGTEPVDNRVRWNRYVVVSRHAVYAFETQDEVVGVQRGFVVMRGPTNGKTVFLDPRTARRRNGNDGGWENMTIRLYAGVHPHPRPRLLHKKTYESEFRAVDKRAAPLSQEAYEFLDELVTNTVVKPLVEQGSFKSTVADLLFGYYDQSLPAVRFGNSQHTSAEMFQVGKAALARTFMSLSLPNLGTALTNVKTLRLPHFSSIRIWKALRMLFKTKAETNYAAAIVVRFIREIYAHMLQKAGRPYVVGVRPSPGVVAKAKTYAGVRFLPFTLVPREDYELSVHDIVLGLKAMSRQDANFSKVFKWYDNIYPPETRSKNEILQNTLINAFANGELKVSNNKLRGTVRNIANRGFRVSRA